MKHLLAMLRATWAAHRARRQAFDRWLAEVPATEPDPAWTLDDAKSLAAWADTPTGQKVLQRLANRVRDYEAHACIYSTPATASNMTARGRGFRDAYAELRTMTQVSAAGPSPANTPAPGEPPLPPELAHLGG